MHAVLSEQGESPERDRPIPVVLRGPARTRLASAYAKARKAPRDPHLRMALAEALLRTDRRDLVRRHATKAVALASADWPGQAALADLHFRLGNFDVAYDLLKASMLRGEAGPQALRNMSALLYARGDGAASRDYLRRAARLEPIIRPRSHDPTKPTVLRLRSVERSHYGLKFDRSGRIYRRFLRGGHFSLENLMDQSQLNVYFAEISGDNLRSAHSDLPDFQLVINSISCADRNASALREAANLLALYPDAPVINHPLNVLETRRERNFQRLGSIDGVLFPRTELIRNDAAAPVVADRLERRGFSYPMILRLAEKHTGVSMRKLDRRAALVEYLRAAPSGADLYAVQFVDCRGREGVYHKIRVFFIDGVLYPVARLANDTWQIHSGDRYRIMAGREDLRSEERRFLTDPEAYLGNSAVSSLYEICRVIRLDFFGIDFALGREGQVIVFEANAAMRHNFDHAGAFPYTRPHLERVTQAFGEMLTARLAAAAPAG